MNYTSDFFLYKGDEGDFKYLKSEEDMNTPKDEMITEAIHCMVEQETRDMGSALPIKYKIWFYARLRLCQHQAGTSL